MSTTSDTKQSTVIEDSSEQLTTPFLKVRVYAKGVEHRIAPGRAWANEAWLAVTARDVYLQQATPQKQLPRTILDFRRALRISLDLYKPDASWRDINSFAKKHSSENGYAFCLPFRQSLIGFSWIPQYGLDSSKASGRNDRVLVLIFDEKKKRDEIREQIRNRIIPWQMLYVRLLNVFESTPERFRQSYASEINIDLCYIDQEFDFSQPDMHFSESSNVGRRFITHQKTIDEIDFYSKLFFTFGLLVVVTALSTQTAVSRSLPPPKKEKIFCSSIHCMRHMRH